MNEDEEVLIAFHLAEFFWQLEEQVDEDLLNGVITKREMKKRIYEIRESRDLTMIENDPLLKHNSHLREITQDLLELR